jgi:hypothetical protein
LEFLRYLALRASYPSTSSKNLTRYMTVSDSLLAPDKTKPAFPPL